MDNTKILHVDDSCLPDKQWFNDLFTEPAEAQTEDPVDDINVHLTRRVSGQYVTKNDSMRTRSPKPLVTKDQKKKKKQLASLSRKRNKK